MKVSVADGPAVAIAGRHRVTDRAIEFEPRFPFDPGREYLVHVEPAKWPTPRGEAATDVRVSLPRRDPGPPTTVTAIYPSAEIWPANVLRFYVHFSGPMSRASGVPFLRLLDDHGVEVPDALLPAAVDFWSPDQQRYTAFFDPGRVKQGILPNAQMGRALVAGRRYTIAVDQAWLDAFGRPLAREFRHAMTAGAAREQPLTLKSWRVSPPRAGSRDPLVVTLPWAVDQALLERTVGVEFGGQPVTGHSDTAAFETAWRFVPAEPWKAGSHDVVVLSVLEDPSGNRIDQPFEVLPSDPVAHRPPPERFRVPFLVR